MKGNLCKKKAKGKMAKGKKKILKFWGVHGPPGPPTNEATGRGLVSILRLGGQYFYEILKFSKKYVLI